MATQPVSDNVVDDKDTPQSATDDNKMSYYCHKIRTWLKSFISPVFEIVRYDPAQGLNWHRTTVAKIFGWPSSLVDVIFFFLIMLLYLFMIVMAVVLMTHSNLHISSRLEKSYFKFMYFTDDGEENFVMRKRLATKNFLRFRELQRNATCQYRWRKSNLFDDAYYIDKLLMTGVNFPEHIITKMKQFHLCAHDSIPYISYVGKTFFKHGWQKGFNHHVSHVCSFQNFVSRPYYFGLNATIIQMNPDNKNYLAVPVKRECAQNENDKMHAFVITNMSHYLSYTNRKANSKFSQQHNNHTDLQYKGTWSEDLANRPTSNADLIFLKLSQDAFERHEQFLSMISGKYIKKGAEPYEYQCDKIK